MIRYPSSRLFARLVTLAGLALTLGGCVSHQAPSPVTLHVDDSVTAVSHDSRVRYIVLHYTKTSAQDSLKLLSQGQVSTHYLITNDTPAKIYRLVDETRSAWHAGQSRWHQQVSLNPVSIGIELVNSGRKDLPGGETSWEPYAASQIQTLILLLQDLIARHGVRPENIVGHSDIAPQRKTDPGPLFPWKQLAQAGIGRWYDETLVASNWVTLQQEGIPDVAWFQRQLARLGYAAPQHGRLDRDTKNVIAAFQMHYRPARYDGQPDAETAAIMMALPGA